MNAETPVRVAPPLMRSRKRDRRRRVCAWAVCVAAGFALAWLAWSAAMPEIAILAAAAGLAIGHRFMIAPPGAAILTYHSVSPDPAWLPWSKETAVHPETLRTHLRMLRSMGCAIVHTRDLVAAQGAGRPLPPRCVVLHFDDGYRDNLIHAAPLLRAAEAPATFFASLDFVAPEGRQDGGDDGYMSWSELRALDADPLFEVEPHGIDHGRVPVSDRVVGTVTEGNWRRLAWLQWAATPGPKHDWYMKPPALPFGTPVPESEGALAACAWLGDRHETGEEFKARIASHLACCREAFERELGRTPAIFCWPENRVCEEGRAIAAALGYEATTGGKGRNAPGEPAHILSRIHAGDRALGVRFGPAEALKLRAAVRLCQGNHYWYLVTAPMDLARRIVMKLRDRFGRRYA